MQTYNESFCKQACNKYVNTYNMQTWICDTDQNVEQWNVPVTIHAFYEEKIKKTYCQGLKLAHILWNKVKITNIVQWAFTVQWKIGYTIVAHRKNKFCFVPKNQWQNICDRLKPWLWKKGAQRLYPPNSSFIAAFWPKNPPFWPSVHGLARTNEKWKEERRERETNK